MHDDGGGGAVDGQAVLAGDERELLRVLAVEALVGRHPAARGRVALVLVRRPVHRDEIPRIVGERGASGVVPRPGAHVPGVGQRDDVVDLHLGRGLRAALEPDRRAAVRVDQHSRGDCAGARRGADVGLVRQVAVQHVVAGVAAVVPERRRLVVRPRLPEGRATVGLDRKSVV